jgi:lipoprotein-anchoring transpeptidase ErfK/SrfK
MEFTSNYKKREPARRRPRRKRPPVNKKLIIILAAVLVAVICVVTGLVVRHHRQTQAVNAPVAQTQAPTAAPTAAPTEAPETTQSAGEVTITDYKATMYSTTVTLNVRSEPSQEGTKLGMVGQDTPLSVTGKCSNGWYRIDYNGGVGYVSGDYVTVAPGQDEKSDAPYLLKVNRKQNIVIAYAKDDNGDYTKPYKAMVCSVGLDGATPTGTYTTSDKYTWRLLSGNVYGQYATRITGHILFHSVPYFTQSKSDLEYDEYNKLGQPASLGCIRLSVADAKWIYDNCPKGTTVTIYDSDQKEPLEKPTPIHIDTNDSRRVWDPTDPDSNNPW